MTTTGFFGCLFVRGESPRAEAHCLRRLIRHVIILTTEMFPAAGAFKHSLPSLAGFADPVWVKTFRNGGADQDRPEPEHAPIDPTDARN